MAKTSPVGLLREQTASRAVNSAIESQRRASQAANQCPIVNGAAVPGVVFDINVAKDVPHGLGRAWRGYLVTQMQAGSSCTLRALAKQTDATKFVTLETDASAVIDLWVY